MPHTNYFKVLINKTVNKVNFNVFRHSNTIKIYKVQTVSVCRNFIKMSDLDHKCNKVGCVFPMTDLPNEKFGQMIGKADPTLFHESYHKPKFVSFTPLLENTIK